MRCNNCGYENDPNARTCVKCNQPLSEQPVMGYGDYYRRVANSEENLKETRLQNEGFIQDNALKRTVVQGRGVGGNEKQTQIQATCPRCHYPMQGDYCPNCGYGQQAEAPVINDDVLQQLTCKCQKCGKEVDYSFRFCPDCGTEIEKRTINPFGHAAAEAKQEVPKPQCTLTLLNETEGGLTDGETKTYCGDAVILNRDNTEPGNLTITSKEQAELTHDDDGWAIENRSEYGATMVAANHKIRLQPGEIILLGNRRFRFDVTQ